MRHTLIDNACYVVPACSNDAAGQTFIVEAVMDGDVTEVVLRHCTSVRPMLQERALDALQNLFEVASVHSRLVRERGVARALVGVLKSGASNVRDGSQRAALATLKLIQGD